MENYPTGRLFTGREYVQKLDVDSSFQRQTSPGVMFKQFGHHLNDADSRRDGIAGKMGLEDRMLRIQPECIARSVFRDSRLFEKEKVVQQFHAGQFIGSAG